MRAEVLAVLLVGAGGCDRPPPAPVIREVTPAWAFNQEDTPIVLRGDHLLPGVDASASGAASLDDAYLVTLTRDGDSRALFGVRQDEVNEVTAIVPAGLAVGGWTLSVQTPYGQQATWSELFEVLDTRADALNLVVEDVSYQVFDPIAVTLSLVDPFGVPLAQDRAVRVTVEAVDGGAVDAGFADGSLEAQVALTDAVGIEGRLGDDGLATLQLTVRTADILVVRAAPATAGDPVTADDVALRVDDGTPAQVRLTLPEQDFVAEAGAPFDVLLELLDAEGNPLPDAEAFVAFADTCGSSAGIAELRGAGVLSWVPRRATGAVGCEDMQIFVTSGGLTGASTPFEVRPGPAAALDVDVSPLSLTAGETLNTFVTAVDAYGNETPWSGAVVVVQDNLGGVVDAPCGAVAPVYCAVTVGRAGEGLTLTVVDDAGLRGTSPAFEVVPGPPASVDVDAPPSWVAGATSLVPVGVRDAFDNTLPSSLVPTGGVEITDELGEIACAEATRRADAVVLGCALTTARADATLTASVPALGVGGLAGPVQVVNGPLASISVTVADASVAAGEPVVVDVSTADAWGNPWSSRAVHTVRLSDTAESAAPVDVVLDAAGVGAGVMVFGAKGLTVVEARVVGVVGRSEVVDVDAGPPASLRVGFDLPWLRVSEPAAVNVDAVDAFGNVVDGFFGTATLRSASGIAAPVDVLLVNGTGAGVMVWGGATAVDAVSASSPALSGQSRQVSVVRDCGGMGPTAVLRFSGRSHGVACAPQAGSVVTLPASFNGSVAAPGASLVLYGLSVDGATPTTATSSTVIVPLSREGVFSAAGLVVQSDGCAAEVAADLYVGVDDGQPVGPMVLQSSLGVLDVGPGAAPATIAVLGATTCRGVPASGGEVLLRADRGALTGLRSTGAGLALDLDVTGSGVATLDPRGVWVGGAATVVATTDAGTASGAVTVAMEGDLLPPWVWWQTPKGALDGPVDLINVRFSEVMDPQTVTIDAFAVVGAGAPNVVGVALGAGNREVDLTLAAPIVGGQQWQLSIAPTVRDREGNALAGTWGGAGVGYTGPLGLAGAVDPITTCVRSTERFRPDGDDGPGEQADQVDLRFQAASQPAWWVVSVEDASGQLIERRYLSPNGAVDSWAWDGRDGQGRVVPAGSYLLEVVPEGSLGNQGIGCQRNVDVTQREAP